MNIFFSIKNDDIHIWRANLPSLTSQIDRFLTILSADELERAQRFRFTKHRERFIVARALLRYILSHYIKTSPEKIIFSYGIHGKPYLALNPIHFNTSHSHDMAVYAFSLNHEIGIDIEKIEPHFNLQVAKRFFSKEEYDYLTELPEAQKNKMFYTIWSRKEALIKAMGSGLYTSLNEFSCVLKEPSHIFINEPSQTVCFEKIRSETPYQKVHSEKIRSEIPSQKVHSEKIRSEISSQKVHSEKIRSEIPSQKVHSEKIRSEIPSQKVDSQETSQREISFQEIHFQNQHYQLANFAVDPSYQAAIAVIPPIADISFREWQEQGPATWR